MIALYASRTRATKCFAQVALIFFDIETVKPYRKAGYVGGEVRVLLPITWLMKFLNDIFLLELRLDNV